MLVLFGYLIHSRYLPHSSTLFTWPSPNKAHSSTGAHLPYLAHIIYLNYLVLTSSVYHAFLVFMLSTLLAWHSHYPFCLLALLTWHPPSAAGAHLPYLVFALDTWHAHSTYLLNCSLTHYVLYLPDTWLIYLAFTYRKGTHFPLLMFSYRTGTHICFTFLALISPTHLPLLGLTLHAWHTHVDYLNHTIYFICLARTQLCHVLQPWILSHGPDVASYCIDESSAYSHSRESTSKLLHYQTTSPHHHS